jgi:hypothetical protein
MWPIRTLESGEVVTPGNPNPHYVSTQVLDRMWFGQVASWRDLSRNVWL